MAKKAVVAQVMALGGLTEEKAAEVVSVTEEALRAEHQEAAAPATAGAESGPATSPTEEPVSDADRDAAAEKAALAKAEEAFGQRHSEDPADRAYAEPNGVVG